MKKQFSLLSLITALNTISLSALPIHEAVSTGNLAEVQRLITENPACVNAQEKRIFKHTPLHIAAEWGPLEIVQFLLDKGANVNAKSTQGNTPLHYAAKQNEAAIAQLLLERGAAINDQRSLDGWAPLHFAAFNNSTETLQLLLERGANVDIQNKDKETPLVLATRKDHAGAAQLLLEYHANIHHCGSALHRTPLHIAAEEHHIKTATILLAGGANINAQDHWGETPLHLVAKAGDDIAMAQLLLDRGGNVNAQGICGVTPLNLALFYGTAEMAQFLRERGALEGDQLADV